MIKLTLPDAKFAFSGWANVSLSKKPVEFLASNSGGPSDLLHQEAIVLILVMFCCAVVLNVLLIRKMLNDPRLDAGFEEVDPYGPNDDLFRSEGPNNRGL